MEEWGEEERRSRRQGAQTSYVAALLRAAPPPAQLTDKQVLGLLLAPVRLALYLASPPAAVAGLVGFGCRACYNTCLHVAYVSIRRAYVHLSAWEYIRRQHTHVAYVSIRRAYVLDIVQAITHALYCMHACQHTSVSIRQHTPAYAIIRQPMRMLRQRASAHWISCILHHMPTTPATPADIACACCDATPPSFSSPSSCTLRPRA